MKKINAYTLTEVMVGMAISSLLILFVYMFFGMIHTYFKQVQHRSEIQADQLLLRNALARDIDLSDSVTANDHMIHFHVKDTLITWQFTDTSVSRGTGWGARLWQGEITCALHNYHKSQVAGKDLRLLSGLSVIWPVGKDDSLRFDFYKNYAVNMEVNK